MGYVDVVARAEYLWYLAARQMPLQAEAVACLLGGKAVTCQRGRDRLFSRCRRSTLATCSARGAKDLAVIPSASIGWTEWTCAQDVNRLA